MSAGNFDRDSASRISRVVRYVEGGWPVGTRRERRPPIGDTTEGLLLVRLCENIPPAKLFPVPDNFYDRFKEALGDRNANQVDPAELLTIGSEIINEVTDDITATTGTITDRYFGSGYAWLCEIEPGRNRETTQNGAVSNILIRYTEVVRVWNMHSRAYNINDIGGAFGDEAGSLGSGFCNAIRGWDGELWLVQPDRKLEVQLINSVDSVLNTVTALSAELTSVIAFLNYMYEDPSWREYPGVP